jgi:hypothetical protein
MGVGLTLAAGFLGAGKLCSSTTSRRTDARAGAHEPRRCHPSSATIPQHTATDHGLRSDSVGTRDDTRKRFGLGLTPEQKSDLVEFLKSL